mgnify:CR=1 FL=1
MSGYVNIILDILKTLCYHYVYDRMNQLVRADDNVSHKTYVYTYDVGGNRTATKIYDFTLETLEGEPTVITQTYGFDLDSNVMLWNDRLKTYNGKQIIYDLEGNPVSYGGKTLNWYGKQLKQVTAADGSYTQYDYDANGLRTQKRQYKADGTTDYTVDYVWSDGKIAVQSLTYPLTMTIQGNTVTRDIKIDSKFIYCDDDATPSAIMLENDEYLLVRNLQGDVVAVVNAANGETVVEFSYDPWGNVTRKYSETYTDGATEEELKLLDLVMSALCPVTYRGYNYDFTTGLYYLQSRYYNPEWGRFLNTDDTAIMLTKTDDAFSANMYLYCNNNPVNKVDYDGRDAEKIDIPFLEACIDLIGVICNDFNLNGNLKNGFFKLYKNVSKPLLYNLQIKFDNSDDPRVYSAVKRCFYMSSELTCEIIALFAGIYFQRIIKRQFLFSPECMCREIKYHILSYMIGYKKSHANPVDIYEGDVYINKSQNEIFDYYNGIRKCYKWTEADPYLVTQYIGNQKILTREKVKYISSSKTAWEGELFKYGK